jgi:hypothetical protein
VSKYAGSKLSDFIGGIEIFLEKHENLMQKPRLKEIKVNSLYLPKLLEHVQTIDKEFSFRQLGIGYIDLYNGVPLIIDESIETYKLVFHE